MFSRRSRGSHQIADDYVLSDSTLRALDHGLGELRVDGELKGFLASTVREMRFPARQPWPWFLVVWLDGSRELPIEDYGPKWYTVRELDAGHLDYHEPSTGWEKVIFGHRYYSKKRGPDRVYDFAWLPADEASQKWQELGLVDSDF
jgi:hypothetical protein